MGKLATKSQKKVKQFWAFWLKIFLRLLQLLTGFSTAVRVDFIQSEAYISSRKAFSTI
jgi:hypothetical protein